MAEYLKWDQDGEREYETGVDHGILFRKSETGYEAGVAWNGLSSIDESPSGAEANDIYADNIKYLSLTSAEDFGGTINAYTYPKEFAECNGEKVVNGVKVGQQTRKPFGTYYRTIKGNDVLGNDYGHIHHLVYNAKCSPSDASYSTVSDSPEAIEMSWEFTTTPVNLSTKDSAGNTLKPTAILKIDDTLAEHASAFGKFLLQNLLNTLYGSTAAATAGYFATEDATKAEGKTYYEITKTGTGDEAVYSFEATSDETLSSTKTYFEAVAATTVGSDTVYLPYLPTPDQVLTMLGAEAPN